MINSALESVRNIYAKGGVVLKFGYARVSTNEQELASQIEYLRNAGAEKIYSEKFTGTKRERPQLDELLKVLCPADSHKAGSSFSFRSTRDSFNLRITSKRYRGKYTQHG